jgi:signal transduction histidine kinase/ligand-binding sensor domain-containing protein
MRQVFCWLLTGAALFVDAAYAVDPTRAMSQYIRDRWAAEQGFPRGPVYSITQTADGYLWIGTEAGLVRFDGLNFRLITDKSSRIGSVLGLTVDKEDNLWVRLSGPTMLRYRDGVFEDAMSTLGMPYSNVTGMSRTNDGRLLISRLENGTVTYSNGKFEVLAAATPPARSPVLSLAQTSDGNVWLGTRDAGLFRVTGNQVSAVVKGLPDTKINCLLPDSDRRLWVGTDRGIALWNGSELNSGGLPATLNRFQALAMARDRDANIWVGTDARGLLRVNAQGVSFLSGSDGSGEAVTAVFEDREGNLWIGSANGLERLRDSPFVTYSLSEGLPSGGGHGIFVDSENRTWFPPVDHGLWWLKDGQHGRITTDGLDRDVVYSITGRRGELWLGRQRGGLTQLRVENGSSITKTYTQTDGLAQNSVYSVHQSRDGTVWAGTLSGGVSRFQNGRFTTHTTGNGLVSNTVTSILEGSDGTMWFATPSGLSALSNGGWKTYTAGNGLPSANVNCLLEDSSGVLWAGTAAGLAFRGSGGFHAPAGVPAALREQILGIAEDKYEFMWLATSNHVLRVKRDKLLQGSLSDGDVREYGPADGLRGVEGVKGHRSVVTDSLGRIWFSMNRGISVVDPGRLASSSARAMVHVQAMSADGTPIDSRGPVRIPASRRQRITFNYAGLSLSVPERVRFRYSLDGFDRGWSEPVSTREAIYTNLGPGSYRFRVIASNADGVWNGSEASIGFEIEPAFWQTWWFLLSGVLACGLSILALYRFRLHRLMRQLSMRFEERLAERTRIAQELHDTLLQGFLSASMQLHVAADRLPDNSPVKQSLSRVLQLMGQVIEEGRNAVQGLRSPQNASNDLEQAFSRIQQDMGIQEEIGFRVIVEGQPRPLHPILRDEVYRIGREALVNAFRHSRAKNIEIELEYAANCFRFLVRDNGCGIDPKVLQAGREGHWGLPGMRERAERIGAGLHVWSSATAGTEVELSVPGHVAFQAQPSNRPLRWIARLYPRGGGARPPTRKSRRKE